MDPQRAYLAAWSGVESDVRAWVKAYKPGVPSLTLAFADIQARFADSLREDLTDLDVFTRERVVIASLKALRDALSTVGLVPDTTSVTKAKEAVAMSALGATSVVADQEHQEERQAAMDDLVSGDALTWKWKARLDSRTCLFCLSRHGTEHPLGTPMLSHPNCRCRPVPPDTDLADGLEWMRNRSPGTMRKMLGPGRTRLVEQGVPLEDLVDEHRHGVRPIRDFGGMAKGAGAKRPSEMIWAGPHPPPSRTFPSLSPAFRGNFDPKMMPMALSRDDFMRQVGYWFKEGFGIIEKRFRSGSVWNGEVWVDSNFPDDWAGLKTFDCPIALNPKFMFRYAKAFRQESGDYAYFDFDTMDTVLHELIHSFSYLNTGTTKSQNAYSTSPGMEEGMTSVLSRSLLPKLIDKMIRDAGMSDEYRAQVVKAYGKWAGLPKAYQTWVILFEALAEDMGMTPPALALKMLKTPADERIPDFASMLIDVGWETPEPIAAVDEQDAVEYWLRKVLGPESVGATMGKEVPPEPVIEESDLGFKVTVGPKNQQAMLIVKKPPPEWGYGPEARVGWVGVPPAMQRQGIATRMYAVAAAEARRRYGVPLRSDYSNVTPEAEAVWKALVVKGLARYIGPVQVGPEDDPIRFGEYEYRDITALEEAIAAIGGITPGSFNADMAERLPDAPDQVGTALSMWRSSFSVSSSMRAIIEGRDPAPAYAQDLSMHYYAYVLRDAVVAADPFERDTWRIESGSPPKVGAKVIRRAVSVAADRAEAEGFRNTLVYTDQTVLYHFPPEARGLWYSGTEFLPAEGILSGRFKVTSVRKEGPDWVVELA